VDSLGLATIPTGPRRNPAPASPSAVYRIRKRPTGFESSTGRLVLVSVVAGALAAAAAGADGPAWQVTRGDVRIVLPMKPGGAFDAKTTALTGRLVPREGKPMPIDGALVDLSTIDTGIELRNRHMRENHLEIQKGAGFDKARLTDLRLTDAADAGFTGRTGFTATLRISLSRSRISPSRSPCTSASVSRTGSC
jgi:hypothetical protein